MPDDFWPNALRDLALLVAGSLFTLLGSWRTNAAATKREKLKADQDRKDAQLARERDALVAAQESVNALWVGAREQMEKSGSDQISFPRDAVTTTESTIYLIHDSKIRSVISKALAALEALRTPVNMGYLDRAPRDLQRQILVSSIQVLSALLRGDPAPKADLKQLRDIGDKTEAAWREARPSNLPSE